MGDEACSCGVLGSRRPGRRSGRRGQGGSAHAALHSGVSESVGHTVSAPATPATPTSHTLPPPPPHTHGQVPHDDNRLLLRNCLMMLAVGAGAACFGLLAVEARMVLS